MPRPWNAYGRRPVLVRVAAQDVRAHLLRHARAGDRLLLGLDRARAGDHREVALADRDAGDVDDRRVLMQLARDELVRLADADDLFDVGERRERQLHEPRRVADEADDGAELARGDERLPAHGLHLVDDACDVGL